MIEERDYQSDHSGRSVEKRDLPTVSEVAEDVTPRLTADGQMKAPDTNTDSFGPDASMPQTQGSNIKDFKVEDLSTPKTINSPTGLRVDTKPPTPVPEEEEEKPATPGFLHMGASNMLSVESPERFRRKSSVAPRLDFNLIRDGSQLTDSDYDYTYVTAGENTTRLNAHLFATNIGTTRHLDIGHELVSEKAASDEDEGEL